MVQPAPWQTYLGGVHHCDVVHALHAFPEASVDCIIADPPFNLGVEYGAHDDKLKSGDYLTWCARWLEECAYILKPTGSLWLCISEEYTAELKVLAEGAGYLPRGSPTVIQREGPPLRMRHEVIWYYTFGVNSPRKLTRSHTTIWHLVRSLKQHQWFPDAVRVASARQAVYNDARANPAGRLPDDTWILRPQQLAAVLDGGDDVQYVPRINGTFKARQPVPNQFPEQLYARMIRLCTAPRDLVVEPFGGSFTACAAAKKLDRQFAGFDNDHGCVLRGMARLQAAQPGEMLDQPAVLPVAPRPARTRSRT